MGVRITKYLTRETALGFAIQELSKLSDSKLEDMLMQVIDDRYSSYKICDYSELDNLLDEGYAVIKPDWDDVQITFTTPNGFDLSCLTVCGNEITESDSLEGLDGFIYIETKEELDEFLSKTYEEILHELDEKYDNFDFDEYS